jgi:hypothetical protein
MPIDPNKAEAAALARRLAETGTNLVVATPHLIRRRGTPQATPPPQRDVDTAIVRHLGVVTETCLFLLERAFPGSTHTE